MSRHIVDAKFEDHPIRVTVGFDRPSNSFYLHIGWVSARTGSVFAYAADLKLAYDPSDWRTIRGFLESQRIVVPESVWTELAFDRATGRGNRVVRHHADGRMKELMAW
ncbi:hypothetical protein ACFPN2_21580 [Steroidobacter flavus]|uniref:Transposase n=1 Tax=Steroidobacter flavus TaxID=1842136 RepID=A0ABV8SW46_9GAMM